MELLDDTFPFIICVLLDCERLGPIRMLNPFIFDAIRRSLTLLEVLTTYESLNWSPFTTAEGASATSVYLSFANPGSIITARSKKIMYLFISYQFFSKSLPDWAFITF